MEKKSKSEYQAAVMLLGPFRYDAQYHVIWNGHTQANHTNGTLNIFDPDTLAPVPYMSLLHRFRLKREFAPEPENNDE